VNPLPIRVAQGARDTALARALIEEYAAWLGVDLCFQGLDEELATLPGKYAPPSGRLLLAGEPGDAVGCVALRPRATGSFGAPDAAFVAPVGEVKRLYVQPRARGAGAGRALAAAIVDAARTIGYRTLCLDTLERMHAARALYESLGFRPCERYYDNPLDDVVYYALAL
jgi:GNAT superfamily N-acetyltransferase